LGKTHLGGQDVKAPVMGGREVGEDSPSWPRCQGSSYERKISWGEFTWLAKMSRLHSYGRKISWGKLTWVTTMSRLLLWEEEKLGKTHLVGQDVKAPQLWEEDKLGKTHLVCQDVKAPQLWEEDKLGKTHLGGQDVKAPVMGRGEVGEDSPG
jgi:hypothetical protein